jgi:YD repeat-containing protein
MATFPSGLYETYSWDNLGQMTRRTDRKGNAVYYYYDYQNQLYQKLYPDSSTVNYTYDAAGRLTQVQDKNYLGNVVTGTYGFAYDNMGRLTSTTTNYVFDTAGTYTVQYGYDAASNRATMTDPQSGATHYNYDTLNRLSSLNDPQSNNFTFQYDALSRRTQLTRPNGVNTNYAYDNLSRLLSVLHQVGSTTLDGASYSYDAAGNRTSKTNHLNGVEP